MNSHLLILGVLLAVTASATATETRHMRASTQTGAPIVATNKKKVPAPTTPPATRDAACTGRNTEECSELQGECRFMSVPTRDDKTAGKCVAYDFVSSKRVTVFIIGGGFQGVTAALAMSRDTTGYPTTNVEVVLVEEHPTLLTSMDEIILSRKTAKLVVNEVESGRLNKWL